MACAGYFSLGDKVRDNIIDNLCPGNIEIVVRTLLLAHWVTVVPICVNIPNQDMEEMLAIPKDFNWRRCLYRTGVMAVLLLVAEVVPDFGSILDLLGGSVVTLMAFVFPPLFYMRLVDQSQQHTQCSQRTLSTAERVYCWSLMVFGVVCGAFATFTSFKNIISNTLSPPFCMGMETGLNRTSSDMCQSF